MIEAERVDEAFAEPAADQLVRGLEHRLVLDAHAGQFVHVEEAPVVDLVDRRSPDARRYGCASSRLCSSSYECGCPGWPLTSATACGDRLDDDGCSSPRRSSGHAALPSRAAAPRSLRVRVGVGRKVVQPREDALEFVARRARRRAPRSAHDGCRQDKGDCRGLIGQAVVEVAQPERAVLVVELELAALEHAPVVVAEDRQQHLVRSSAWRRPSRCRRIARTVARAFSSSPTTTRSRRRPCDWARCRDQPQAVPAAHSASRARRPRAELRVERAWSTMS